ncbi:MAG: DUF1631 family protein [Pseudomonadota bacterium]
MSTHAADVADQYATLYQATLAQAAQAGGAIMEKMLAAARQSLKDRAAQARSFFDRDHCELSLRLLDSHSRTLSERYPQALRSAFRQASATGPQSLAPVVAALQNVQFDQLELMGSEQVHQSVELARAQQSVLLAADVALSELNTYICATLGMQAVHPDRNPIRPEIFVRALQELLAQSQVPMGVQMDWLQHMSKALGNELSALYKTLSQQLHSEGVAAAGYVVVRTHAGATRSGAGRTDSSTMGSSPSRSVADKKNSAEDSSLLTLDSLRRLLAGELDAPSEAAGLESFAAQFSREFESHDDEPPPSDFAATMPAAFEALKEMKQLDRMVERIGNRRHAARAGKAERGARQESPQEVREQLRHTSNGLGQALSLEVVALMVENIARDARLLAPIREVVKNLEPALLRLALVDPRFFSDKLHPARRLLQEITHRSLAYDIVDTHGFTGFLEPLQQIAGSLASQQIQDAEPFEQALAALIGVWDAQKPPMPMEKAVQALQHAEERHLLAKKIALEMAGRPDVQQLSAGLLDFIYGPWAQVMAHAQLAAPLGAEDPGRYREFVALLAWSARPELTRKNIKRLTQLVPKLLGKLREGLHLIDYPSLKTSAFFELLMNLHQQAFKPQTKVVVLPQADSLHASLFDAEETWIGPAEAEITGFMEAEPEMASPAQDQDESMPELDAAVAASDEPTLPVGAWVELLINGVWGRAQLSWTSPHGSLFLFTSAYGDTHSMTRRSRDKLLAAGSMRIVSGQTVVDGALDAVAKTAILNSLDIKP